MKEVWKAQDGTTFDSGAECLAYEDRLEIEQLVEKVKKGESLGLYEKNVLDRIKKEQNRMLRYDKNISEDEAFKSACEQYLNIKKSFFRSDKMIVHTYKRIKLEDWEYELLKDNDEGMREYQAYESDGDNYEVDNSDWGEELDRRDPFEGSPN